MRNIKGYKEFRICDWLRSLNQEKGYNCLSCIEVRKGGLKENRRIAQVVDLLQNIFSLNSDCIDLIG